MKDLFNDDDRQQLARTMREMFAPLGCERFTIIGLTADGNKAFLVLFQRDGEQPRDWRGEMIKILASNVDSNDMVF